MPPPPPIIFEHQVLPKQTIYHWKGNLTASRIHFRYWKNILISRLYDFPEMTSQWLQNGCPKNFKLLKYQHIILSLEIKIFLQYLK